MMAEEYQKYKEILEREQEEFRKQLIREVSVSWSSKQYFKLNEIKIL